jgi:molybdopterin converting factor small subunit
MTSRRIKVRVRFAGYLRNLLGEEIEVECYQGITIHELLEEIIRSSDTSFTISDSEFIFAIDGKEINSNKELTRDCIVDVYPIVQGGISF